MKKFVPFCGWHLACKEYKNGCSAHLCEGHFSQCPYKSLNDARHLDKDGKPTGEFYPCEDVKPIEKKDLGGKMRKKVYHTLFGWPDLSTCGVWEMHNLAWAELGKSLIYMDFMNDYNIDGTKVSWEPQRTAVCKLCRKLAANMRVKQCLDSQENRLWWRQFLSDIAEEIENQC